MIKSLSSSGQAAHPTFRSCPLCGAFPRCSKRPCSGQQWRQAQVWLPRSVVAARFLLGLGELCIWCPPPNLADRPSTQEPCSVSHSVMLA